MTESKHRERAFFNVHYSLKSIADAVAGSFVLVFLYHQGLSFSVLALSLAGVYMLRLALRTLLHPLMERLNLKHGFIIGILIYPLRYLVIIPVHGFDIWFFLFLGFFALSEAFYYTFYHAYWSSAMSARHRSVDYGLREATAQVSGIVGVVVSGYLLAATGPWYSFVFGALFAAVSCLPLLKLPGAPAQISHHLSRRQAAPHVRFMRHIMIAEGFFAIGMGSMWSLVLFTVTDTRFAEFGLMLAIAAALYASGEYLLGRYFAMMPRHWLAVAGATLMVADLAGRALFATSIPVIIAFNLLAAIASVAYYMCQDQISYGCMRDSGLPFHAAWHHETGWDIGAILGLLATAMILHAGLGLRTALLVLALGSAIVGLHMYYYYRPKRGTRETHAVWNPITAVGKRILG